MQTEPMKFPNNSSEWFDSDGDGVGDSDEFIYDGSGTNANGSNADAFPNDPNEWKDTDGDGYGNNGDWAPTTRR